LRQHCARQGFSCRAVIEARARGVFARRGEYQFCSVTRSIRAARECAQAAEVKFLMYGSAIRAAAIVILTLLAAGCTVTAHDIRESSPVAGKAGSVQHIERVEWHRNVDDSGHILDTGDEQFTVLNSATVTNDSLQILTGVGFIPGDEGDRQLITIPFSDIVEIKLIKHPLSAVNMVIPLNAGTWGSRVLITTKDGAHELLSVAKGNANAPEVYSPTRGEFLPSSRGSRVIRGLWWPDRDKTRSLAALLQQKVAAFQER
jgi:hypothetical protein